MKSRGMARRRRYYCTVCFAEIREYPALVENSAQLVCKKCQNERDEFSPTPGQEVAREIAVLLGHGASVQAVGDELTKSMNREEDKQRISAYRQAIQSIQQ